MDSQEHHIDISFHARYYTFGKLTDKTKTVWFAIHGYGQLAKYFIRKFEVLDPEENFIVAPEGLSRFYLKDFEGRIGASWMTRENRLTDIRNYITFLNSLYARLLTTEKKHTINVLGFSQGAATVCRWVTDGNIAFDNLILWAGIFPPDLQINAAQQLLSKKNVQLVIGEQDEYLTEDRIEEMKRISSQLNLSPHLIRYSGGHHIDGQVLHRLASSY